MAQSVLPEPDQALDAATLAALETINAVISDGGGSITVDDGGASLTVDGSVELGATTLAALETINAVVSGEVALDSAALAALETIELGATTLAALESITVVDGGGSITVDSPQLPTLSSGRLPVDGSGVTQPVSGTVTANAGSGTLAVSGPLTDAQFTAQKPFPVTDNSGSLTVDAPVATPIAVRQSDGAAFFDPRDVSDRDARLIGRGKVLDSAGAVIDPAIKGQLPDALDGSGFLKVHEQGTALVDTELPAAAALSDTLGRTSSVPMVASANLVDDGTQLVRARGDVANGLDVDVTRLPAITLPSATTATGTITAAAQTVVLTVPAGYQSWSFIGSGTWAGSVIQFEGSTDGGTTYGNTEMAALTADPTSYLGRAANTAVTGFVSVTQQWVGPCGGFTHVRVRCSSFTAADNVTVGLRALQGQYMAIAYVAGGSVDTELPTAAALADGSANPTAPGVDARPSLFNGTTWDRQHSNWRGTTGDTGTKTATFNGATQTNYDARGAFIFVQMGTVSGTTPTCSITLQGSPDGGTTWVAFGPALANLTATGNTGMIMVYPANLSQTAGATPANLAYATPTASMSLNTFLPGKWRLVFTIGGTTPSFALTAVYAQYQL